MATPKAPLFGEQLIRQGLITKDQLRIALTEQRKSGKQLGRILVELGFLSEAVMRDALGQAFGRESIDLTSLVPDPDTLKKIPRDLARRFNVVPISFNEESQTLTVAMSDIYNLIVLDRLHAQLGSGIEIKQVLAGETEINDAIDQFYGYELSVDGILHEIETGQIDYESLQSDEAEYSQPLVRLVNSILSDAVKRRSSDIHFEPEDGFIRIRYRIDGVMRQIRSLHKNYWSAIAVRLKVMSGMNIAENRAPQDGRFSLTISGRQVDFRVSCLITTHGENIVLRILDRDKAILKINQLGISDQALQSLQLMMARPEGVILVTGPTGSGKTTTLYSILSHLNSEAVNIMTMEDPVEYPLPMIRQTSVNESVNLGFANGVRNMMRQDPDIILVGEIRDRETAAMALEAAMTGHQVYSTLHTNSAIGAIPRLIDLGVLPGTMADNIIGIAAQRLVRKLCQFCKTSYEASDLERKLLGVDSDQPLSLYKGVGCTRCEQHGYHGRIALVEVLRITRPLRDLIAKEVPTGELLKKASSEGFISLSDDGLRRVKEGTTTLEEVTRVIDLTGRI